ncbi:MAG TPA: hypothetical protein VK509_01625 [Polyangiales bacterium]|nr:hypothetical protein [Polyangiales bacterium]
MLSPRAIAGCVALSLLAHALIFFALGSWLDADRTLALELPTEIELGLAEQKPGDPGVPGAPPPAAPAPPEPVRPKPVPKRERPKPPDDGAFALDAGIARPERDPDDAKRADAAVALGADDGIEGGAPALAHGSGSSLLGGGLGLGFGAGGFGNGSGGGGPPGAVVGLHADLQRIGDSSLVLELPALLALIPGWQELLAGSGLDPAEHFARVFVATPSLDRSSLLLTARVRGGERTVKAAVLRLALERKLPAAFADSAGLRVAPWRNRGPTERVAGLAPAGQLLIARPADVGRAEAVAAALARRHANQPGMEHATGLAALLAMYEGEAVALSVEGARTFAPADAKDYVPLGLRISLRHIDEYTAQLRLFGYYESAARAARAKERIEAMRPGLIEHPRSQYLGLQSALREAQLTVDGATLTIDATVTMHQTRYLMHAVSRLLRARSNE